jgi:predicted nucleic acid-binding protein
LAVIVGDTDVLVDYLRGGGLADRVGEALSSGTLAATVVAVFELWQGAHDALEQRAVEALLGGVVLLPLTPAGARRAGEVRRNLRAAGMDIGVADSLVAGICLEHGASLLTRNQKHFERVPMLRLDRPVA